MSSGSGNAFPIDPRNNPECWAAGTEGLSKRELFAAIAMQGLLADPETGPAKTVAQAAVHYADALLAALEEQA